MKSLSTVLRGIELRSQESRIATVSAVWDVQTAGLADEALGSKGRGVVLIANASLSRSAERRTYEPSARNQRCRTRRQSPVERLSGTLISSCNEIPWHMALGSRRQINAVDWEDRRQEGLDSLYNVYFVE